MAILHPKTTALLSPLKFSPSFMFTGASCVDLHLLSFLNLQYDKSLDEVISLEEIKRLFFETPFDSEDQIEKKYDMIQLIEETFPEINFQFGRKENTIASEELRSWCVASEDPTASLSDIQHIRARKGRCDACNLSRVVSHQVNHAAQALFCSLLLILYDTR